VGSLTDLIRVILDFARAHQTLALPIVFVLAFGESLAFISLLLPATVILLGFGAVIGAGDLDFWPFWIVAAFGAAAGDWLSFWLGARYGDRIGQMWPLSRYPTLLPRAHAFFERWGVLAVFFGRFTGPLRASVPLVAGMAWMSPALFQLANVTSAAIWAAGVLAPGSWGMRWIEQIMP
jgi:membrane protein DedA with SNARE-associated domain